MCQDLFDRWLGGDEKAFREIYRLHYPRISQFAATLIGNGSDGEDLAQETFLRLYRSQERYRREGISNGRALIYTIVRRLAFQFAEYRMRWERLSNDYEAISWSMISPERSPHDELSDAEIRTYTELAIDRLPEPQREIILLRHREELTYQEIGQILGCSAERVKSRLHYARTLLRAALQKLRMPSEPG